MRHLGMFFIVLAMALMGCFQSIHPLFHEKDLVFDENLLGSWSHGNNTWTFEKAVSTEKAASTRSMHFIYRIVVEKDSLRLAILWKGVVERACGF